METEIKTVAELNQRKSDKLTVTLWWVCGTMDTYVTVQDLNACSLDYISVPEQANPNDVFMHPFAYQDDRPRV